MISWMQKHNKYLVWTIWVATIAFIGAGFVGWGSYDFGAKAGNVAKVGSIEISQSKLNMAYSDTSMKPSTINRMQGQLDEKKAKEMGLDTNVLLHVLIPKQNLLNFCTRDSGIIVSDEEIAAQTRDISKDFKKMARSTKRFIKVFSMQEG